MLQNDASNVVDGSKVIISSFNEEKGILRTLTFQSKVAKKGYTDETIPSFYLSYKFQVQKKKEKVARYFTNYVVLGNNLNLLILLFNRDYSELFVIHFLFFIHSLLFYSSYLQF